MPTKFFNTEKIISPNETRRVFKSPKRRRNPTWMASDTRANFVDSVPAFHTTGQREYFEKILHSVAQDLSDASPRMGSSGRNQKPKHYRIAKNNFPSQSFIKMPNRVPTDHRYRRCIGTIAMGFIKEKSPNQKAVYQLQEQIAAKLLKTEKFIKKSLVKANKLLPKTLHVSFSDLEFKFSQLENQEQLCFRFDTEDIGLADKRQSVSATHRIMALLGILSLLEVAESELTWRQADVSDAYLFTNRLAEKMWELDLEVYWQNKPREAPDLLTVKAYFDSEKKKKAISQEKALVAGVYPGWVRFYKRKPYVPHEFRPPTGSRILVKKMDATTS